MLAGVSAESVSAVLELVQILVVPLLSVVLAEVRAMRRLSRGSR